jgi:hypothetical protein
LYIEAVGGNSLFLVQVDGQPRESTLLPSAVTPARVGQGFELPVEVGLGLRRTNTLRTVRYIRDTTGAGAIDDMHDFGWVRTPTNAQGQPAAFPFWPPGRYLLAVRAEAAQLGDYDGGGDMVISHGQDVDDASRGFVRRARYWVGLSGSSAAVTAVRYMKGQPLVELIVWR